MVRRMRRVLALLREHPGGGKRGRLHTETQESFAVVVEVVRVGYAVALYIGSTWILRIRPPVIAFRKIVVLPAGASRTVRSGHGDGSLLNIGIGGPKYPGTLDRGDIESGRPSPQPRSGGWD